MLRTLCGALLATFVCSAASAYGNDNHEAQRERSNQQERDVRWAKQRKTAEDEKRRTRKSADDQRQRLQAHGSLHETASPFVRPSRSAVTWNSRGLGMATRASSIRAGTSIYVRLHTTPQSLVSQLRAPYQMGFIHSLLGRRTGATAMATLDLRRLTQPEAAIMNADDEQQRLRDLTRERTTAPSMFAQLRLP